MFSKKIVFLSLISVGVFLFADQIMAAVMSQYTPLVSIPGVGAPKNLSQYLVGLYNFLLSIVGIVAVLMFIVGGFKYFTAAGNPSAASDAKDTIYNAAYGLILALMSWVIVSTINPDVLVIKRPGSKSLGTYNSTCVQIPAPPAIPVTISNPPDPVGTICPCNDTSGAPVTLRANSDCDNDCRDAGKCVKQIVSCIAPGLSNHPDTKGYCDCLNGRRLKGPFPCNTVCDTTSSGPLFDNYCTNVEVSYSKDNINFVDFTKQINDLVVYSGDVYYFKVKLIDPHPVSVIPTASRYFIATFYRDALANILPSSPQPPGCESVVPPSNASICSISTGKDAVTIRVQFGVAHDFGVNQFYVSNGSYSGPYTIRSGLVEVWIKIL